jgi:hypothetical protein
VSRNFDGSTGWKETSVAAGALLNPGGPYWTLATWVWWDTVGGGYALMTHFYNVSSQVLPMVLGVADSTSLSSSPGQLCVGLHVTGSWGATGWSGSIQSGRWYHVAGTHDGTYGRIWVNGVLGGMSTLNGTTISSSNQFRLARRWDGNTFFDGKMYDAAVWHATLQGHEIAQLAQGVRPGVVRPEALRAWWKLEEPINSPDYSRTGATMSVGGLVSNFSDPYYQVPPMIQPWALTELSVGLVRMEML